MAIFRVIASPRGQDGNCTFPVIPESWLTLPGFSLSKEVSLKFQRKNFASTGLDAVWLADLQSQEKETFHFILFASSATLAEGFAKSDACFMREAALQPGVPLSVLISL